MPATTTESLLGPATGQLILDVIGDDNVATTHFVNDAKCSIGSGEQCGIRIQSEGIRPVHCVILRSFDRTIVRRWAGNTWLNGRPFDDTTLRAGDELRLANVRIQVVRDERDAEPRGGSRLRNALSSSQWSTDSATTAEKSASQNDSSAAQQTEQTGQSQRPDELDAPQTNDSQLAARIAALEGMLQNVVPSSSSSVGLDESQAAAWQQEKTEFERKLADSKSRIQELETTTVEQEKDIQRLETQIGEVREDIPALPPVDDDREAVWQAKFDELEAERQAEEAVNRQYQDDLKGKVKELTASIAENEEEIEDLKEQVSTHQEATASARGELEAKTKELETLVETANEVDADRLSELEKRQEEDVQVWETQKAELDEKVKGLEEQLASEAGEWEQEKAELVSQIASFEENASEVAKQEESVVAERDELAEKCKALTSEKDALASERDELNEQVASLTSAQEESANAQQAELEEKLNQLNQDREEFEQQRSQLESDRQSFEAEREQLASNATHSNDDGYVDVALDYASQITGESGTGIAESSSIGSTDEEAVEPSDVSRFLDSLEESTSVEPIEEVTSDYESDDAADPEEETYSDAVDIEGEAVDSSEHADADAAAIGDYDEPSESVAVLESSDESESYDDTSASGDIFAEHPAPVSTDDDIDESDRGWHSDDEPAESDDGPVEDEVSDHGAATAEPTEDEPYDDENEERAEANVFADDESSYDFLSTVEENAEAKEAKDSLNWSSTLFDEDAPSAETPEDTYEESDQGEGASSVDFLSQLNQESAESADEVATQEEPFEGSSLFDELIDTDPADSSSGSSEFSNAAVHDFQNSDNDPPESFDDGSGDDAWFGDETAEQQPYEANEENSDNKENTHDFLSKLGEKPDFGLTENESSESDFDNEIGLLESESSESWKSDAFGENEAPEESGSKQNTHDFLSKLGEKPDFGLTDDRESGEIGNEFGGNESGGDDFGNDDFGNDDGRQDDGGDGIDAFLSKLGERPASPAGNDATPSDDDADCELDEWGLPIEKPARKEGATSSILDANESAGEAFDDSHFFDDPKEEALTAEEDFSQIDDGGDVSIEDYMNNLLARVGGGPSDQAAPAPQSVNTAAPSVATPAVAESPAASLPQPSVPVLADPEPSPMSPSEFVPRSRAPKENLAAMRELANASTRSAIERADKSRTGVMMLTNLGGSLIPILVGLSLVMFGLKGYYTLLVFGLICCLVGGYMFNKSYNALRESRGLESSKNEKLAAKVKG